MGTGDFFLKYEKKVNKNKLYQKENIKYKVPLVPDSQSYSPGVTTIHNS